MSRLEVGGLVGSLRSGAWSAAVFDGVVGRAPASMEIERLSLLAPLYDADLDAAESVAAVEDLRRRVAALDGLLIVTPEYNHGLPGGLKNTIDWLSRPGYRSPLRDLPVAIVGSAPGPVGAARALGQLKQVLNGTASALLPWPDLAVGRVVDRLADGSLDDDTASRVDALLEDFASWVDAVTPYRRRSSN
jgi:chromate reductase